MRKRFGFFRCGFLFIFFCASILYGETDKTSRQEGYVGAGIILGSTNGIAVRYHLSETNIVDGRLGVHGNRTEVHCSYLWRLENIIKNPNIIPYAGPGILIQSGGTKVERQYVDVIPGDDPKYENIIVARGMTMGVRGSVGLFYKCSKYDLFLELSPVMEVTPESKFDFDVGMGFCYFFGT